MLYLAPDPLFLTIAKKTAVKRLIVRRIRTRVQPTRDVRVNVNPDVRDVRSSGKRRVSTPVRVSFSQDRLLVCVRSDTLSISYGPTSMT